jgi:hypothetical protein
MFIVYIFLYLIRTLVLHRTFHHERGVFCKFLLPCNLCISGHQSDLFTLLVFFLVSAALQKKCTNINNGVILVSYNKSRLKQAISVMLNSLHFFTERATV